MYLFCHGNAVSVIGLMTISYWLDKSSQKKINCDVTVIGAGIAGLSTCYWLLKEDPSLKVVLVDKGTIGAGASGRNAGFVTCGSVEHFNRLQEKHGPEEAPNFYFGFSLDRANNFLAIAGAEVNPGDSTPNAST